MNIKGEYAYTKDFTSSYSNGVVGGFRTPDELVINFYNETVTLPKTFDLAVDEVSHTIKENGIRTSQITRNITCQVTMNKDAAIKLRDWLNQNIERISNPKKKDDGDTSPDGTPTVNISGLFN